VDRATPEGTARLAARHAHTQTFGTAWDALTVARRGLRVTDGPGPLMMEVGRYLRGGGNLLDVEAEAAAGVKLAAALAAGEVRRDEVVVCAVGGPWSSGEGMEPAPADDVVDDTCLAPAFLRYSLQQSRARLRLECIDLYWLRGADAHRAWLSDVDFRDRLREAFAALEVAVAQGEVAAFGLDLAEAAFPPALALEVAHDVLGDRHHLRGLRYGLQARSLLTERAAGAAADLGLTVLVAGPAGAAPPGVAFTLGDD
jgi:hypothetical protein